MAYTADVLLSEDAMAMKYMDFPHAIGAYNYIDGMIFALLHSGQISEGRAEVYRQANQKFLDDHQYDDNDE